MDDKEFKDLVVGTLKELIGRQDSLDNSIQQLRQETSAEIRQLRQETRADIKELTRRQDNMDNSINQLRAELKTDLKRMDKKIDSILDYVEHVDKEFQRHRTAEI